MKRIEILKEYYDKEMNNVFAYSANYLMNSAKKGYEREFEAAVMKADTLKEMIEEEERKNEAKEVAMKAERFKKMIEEERENEANAVKAWVAKEPEAVKA